MQSQNISSGLLTLFIPHTSASLLIQENADPDVLKDLDRFFNRLVPDGDPLYEYQAEGRVVFGVSQSRCVLAGDRGAGG